MEAEVQKKNPTELLAYQTELLEQILATQKQIINHQIKWSDIQVTALEQIHNRVKNISIIISIMFIVSILGALLYSCGGL